MSSLRLPWALYLQTIYSCAKMKFRELPEDVLRYISHFNRKASCRHVCIRMWKWLQHRHLRHSIAHEYDIRRTIHNLSMQALCTVYMSLKDNTLGGTGAQFCKALAWPKEAAHLHTLI